jgi:hypothetical protein
MPACAPRAFTPAEPCSTAAPSATALRSGVLTLGAMRWAVATGLAVGLVGVLAIAVLDDDRGPAAEDLLAAYERSRTATYVIVETFERRLLDGRTFSSDIVTAQRPPDRLIIDGSTISGIRDGQRLACARAADDELRCRRAPAPNAFEEAVAQDVALFRALITGPRAAYEARHAASGCFELRLRARLLSPPYGEDALMCFDEATGAPRSTRIRRTQSTDTRDTVSIRSDVTDRDLDPALADPGRD